MALAHHCAVDIRLGATTSGATTSGATTRVAPTNSPSALVDLEAWMCVVGATLVVAPDVVAPDVVAPDVVAPDVVALDVCRRGDPRGWPPRF